MKKLPKNKKQKIKQKEKKQMPKATFLKIDGGKTLGVAKGAFSITSPKRGFYTNGSPVLFDILYRADGYSFIDFDNSLKMWWRYTNDGSKGETDRIIYDWSENGILGWTNSSCSYPSAPFGTGTQSQILTYQKRNNYAMTSSFDIDEDENITIAMWYKYLRTVSDNHTFFNNSTANRTIRIYAHSSYGDPWVYIPGYLSDTGYSFFTAHTENIPNGDEWHHLAMVFNKSNNNEVRIYYDGEYTNNNIFLGSKYTPTFLHFDNINFGNTSVNAGLSMSDCMVFSRALSDEEISALYNVNKGDRLQVSVPIDELVTSTLKVYHISDNGAFYQDELSFTVDTSNSSPIITLLGPISDSVRPSGTIDFKFFASSTNRNTNLSSASLYIAESLTDTMQLSGNSGIWTFNIDDMASGDYSWYTSIEDGRSNSNISNSGYFSIAEQLEYHISKDGNDENSGTEASPFLTLQKFCDIAKPGYSCIVHSGVYRESSILSVSGTSEDHISISAASGEVVRISGTDVISSGWSVYSGNIYQCDWSNSLGIGLDQLFINDSGVCEAQIPSISGSYFDIIKAAKSIGPGSNYTSTILYINDNTLTEADDYWNNANVVFTCAPRYRASTGEVTNYWLGYDSGTVGIVSGVVTLADGVFPEWAADGSLTVSSNTYTIATRDTDTQVTLNNTAVNVSSGTDYEIPSLLKISLDTAGAIGSYDINSYGAYVLGGTLNCLTQANEFVVNSGTNTLYLWAPENQNPNDLEVEVKQRNTGILVSGSYIDISDIEVFGCNIELAHTAENVVLDNITGRYLAHYIRTDGKIGSNDFGQTTTGIIINGKNNILRNSDIQHSAGNCVLLMGRYHTVENCEIGYGNYAYTVCAPLQLYRLYDSLITNNVIHHGCREVIFWGTAVRTNLTYNELSFARATNWIWDLGITYSQSTRGGGAEVAYNYIHHPRPGEGSQIGFYFDGPSADFNVHHNIIEYETSTGSLFGILFNGCQEIICHHNFINKTLGFNLSDPEGLTSTFGISTCNNIINSIWVDEGYYSGVMSNNIEMTDLTDEQKGALFIDSANSDYHLSPSSVAIDYGIDLGYEVDYDGNPRNVGSSPDAGPYEYQG